MLTKTALITGADRGIGRATALEFAKHGFRLVLTYYENIAAAEAVREECLHSGAEAVSIFQLDLSDNQSITQTSNKILEKVQQIDVLINNAGVLVKKPIRELTPEEVEWQVNVNLTGGIKFTRALIDRASGSVISIGSALGLAGRRSLSVYSATKFGLRGFAQALAQERTDLLVYVVHPGLTASRPGSLGMPVDKVSRVVYQAANGLIGKPSGSDINVKYYALDKIGRILYIFKFLVKKILGR